MTAPRPPREPRKKMKRLTLKQKAAQIVDFLLDYVERAGSTYTRKSREALR